MQPTVRVHLLSNYPFLWCWDAEDATGRRVQSSWEDHWDAFGSPEEALGAGLVRLGARRRANGAETPARFAAHPGSFALVVVRRGELALYDSLKMVFGAHDEVQVIRDRRSGEWEWRDDEGQALEPRRGDRRARPEVDAQIRALGWSAVLSAGIGAPAANPEIAAGGVRRAEPKQRGAC